MSAVNFKAPYFASAMVAKSMIDRGVKGSTVNTTFTRTEMMKRAAQDAEFRKNFEKVPLGRPAEPEEIAAAVIYLASDAGRFVTGHTLLVDGGFTAV